MSKTVVGNYVTTTDAISRVNDLIAQGYPKNSISVIAGQNAAYTLENAGIVVEDGFEYVDGVNDESLWQRIKAFFSGEDSKLHENSLVAYRDSIREGNILVLVDDDDVPVTLNEHLETMKNGYDVNSYTDETVYANATADIDTDKYDYADKEDETLRLREERMDVNKHNVKSGEAIIHKRVVEETKTVDVPVRHEEIVIERRAVTDEATDDTNFDDETFTIPVMEEQVEVTKHPVVTQEVKVHKRGVENVEHVSTSLRKEELDVDQDGKTIIYDDTSIKQ